MRGAQSAAATLWLSLSLRDTRARLSAQGLRLAGRRAYAAEAARAEGGGGAAAAPAAAAPPSAAPPPHPHSPLITVLWDYLGRKVAEAAARGAAGGRPHSPAAEGLAQLQRQQAAAAAARAAAAPAAAPAAAAAAAPPLPPAPSRVRAAFTYHHHLFDGTPAGRRVQENWLRQVALESKAVEAAARRYRADAAAAAARGAGPSLPAGRRLLLQWFGPLTDAVRAEQARVLAQEKGVDRNVYGPYLLLLDAEQLAVIAMHQTLGAFMSADERSAGERPGPNTARMTRLATAIGRAVEAEVSLARLRAEVHRENMRHRGLRALHRRGVALRERLDAEGDLPTEGWREWRRLGAELQAAGEQMPLDEQLWFRDDGVEERLARVAARVRLPPGVGDAAARRVRALARRLGLPAAPPGSGGAAAAAAAADGAPPPPPPQAHAAPAAGGHEWPTDILSKVGVVLIQKVAQACTLRLPPRRRDAAAAGGAAEHRVAPAFWHNLTMLRADEGRGQYKKYGLLYCHDEVLRRVRPTQLREVVMPAHLPMLLPPVPWQRHNLGGHLTDARASVMRVRSSRLQRALLEAADAEMVSGRGEGCARVYAALNALGATPWAVNREVFSVAAALRAWGGGVCDIPPADDVPLPPPLPKGFALQRPAPGTLALFAQPRAALRARAAAAARARKRNAELHALRCDLELKLTIAAEFAGEERFYFPHSVDFRGRAYPMHPHLNHLGSDMCRGLLQFADARPLGPRGLSWLKVQAANLWGHGVDKLPLEGRERWVDDRLAAVLKNATDPFRPAAPAAEAVAAAAATAAGGAPGLAPEHAAAGAAALGAMRAAAAAAGGRAGGAADDEAGAAAGDAAANEAGAEPDLRWHLAESPFQFLATCLDIQRALASGDPAAYRSRLPVHQDGSCNGLQHYAALGRDATGGWAVNLCPGPAPQDVYSEIARLVAARVARDAAAGVPEAAALLTATRVDRRLVKQTVMTSVYGVTFVGARAQIGARLRERGAPDGDALYRASCYGARATLDCLHEMFQSAKHIMHWLSECARLVAREDRPVAWRTPLGLPVVQPYRKKSRQHVRTVLQRLVLAENSDDLPVLRARQRTAFPPNYVHSVDSAHMMLTALACHDAGLAFAGVHDSFWTHAGSVDEMNGLLRDAFVELHSRPLLEALADDLRRAHPNVCFPPLPPRGDLDLDGVRAATYFFS